MSWAIPTWDRKTGWCCWLAAPKEIPCCCMGEGRDLDSWVVFWELRLCAEAEASR